MNIIESFNRYFSLKEFHSFDDLHFAVGAYQVVCIQQGPVFFNEDKSYGGPSDQIYKCDHRFHLSRGSRPPVGVQWRIER